MKRKQLLSISASVLAAAWIASDAGLVLAQSSSSEKKDKSVGGSQSERTGTDSETPITDKNQKGSGSTQGSGSSTQGSGSKGTKGTSQSGAKDGTTVYPDVNESVGGSKSERGSGGTPLPEKSPFSGTVEKGSGSTEGSSSKGAR
jgi:hypothetical protein